MNYVNHEYHYRTKKLQHSKNYEPYNRPYEKRVEKKEINQFMQTFNPKEWYKK